VHSTTFSKVGSFLFLSRLSLHEERERGRREREHFQFPLPSIGTKRELEDLSKEEASPLRRSIWRERERGREGSYQRGTEKDMTPFQ